ncbi:MAG: class I SAM-dependent methyltransferase [Gemmatimonadaceae bacterium]
MNTPPRELASERERWERLARDPYYAVLNEDGYRLDQDTGDARARFDASGEEDVSRTIAEIRRFIDSDFRPTQALDFGCGVGRLTIPLARICANVTGVDISQTMLDEARRNVDARGLSNVAFVGSAEYFAATSAPQRTLDFIHSYIVFQHIPVAAGMWLADALVRRLVPGGVGALHFTYARRTTRLRRAVHRLRRVVPGMNILANAVQRRPLLEPLIPMNQYDLGALITLLGDRGCTHVHARLTDHGGHMGAMLIFKAG